MWSGGAFGHRDQADTLWAGPLRVSLSAQGWSPTGEQAAAPDPFAHVWLGGKVT